jgi:Beta-propeller repeat
MFNKVMSAIVFGSAVMSPNLLAAATTSNAPNSIALDRPVSFEPNQGQAPSQVSWTARGHGYELFVTSTGASIVLAEPVAEPPLPDSENPIARSGKRLESRNSVVGMNLTGSHPWVTVRGLEPTGGISNYLLGKEKKDWRVGVPQYARLQVAGVYDGIDLVFYAHGSKLEYDFVVAPGANPNQIRLAFDGAASMSIDSKTGDLVVITKTGSEMRHVRPKVYQEVGGRTVEVAGGYQIVDGQASFRLARYDRQSRLIVDPTVQFAAFLQGNNSDWTTGVAVDPAGNSYVTGQTFSTDFPNSAGFVPAKHCPNGLCPSQIFVTRISPTGQLLSSTFLGGSDTDVSNGIAVDATGVWITGETSSLNFATDSQFAFGYWSGFVTKLELDLSARFWCVTFGGGGDSSVVNSSNSIAIDSAGNSYVAGETGSVDFPTSKYFSTTLEPMQKAFAGGSDAFVVKIDKAGLIKNGYSTYLGGGKADAAYGIAVDSTQHAYVTGLTYSADFPKAAEPSYGSLANGGYIAFVTKVSKDGSHPLYSLTVGGTKMADQKYPIDQATSIAVNSADEAYITGLTCSSDFPTNMYSYQQAPPSKCLTSSGGGFYRSAFVFELSHLGTLLFSTYFGGTNGIVYGNSIALSATGNVYVAGDTTTSNLANVSPQIALNPQAGYVAKFNSVLQTVAWTRLVGAEAGTVAVQKPKSVVISNVFPANIFVAGYRYRPGSKINPANSDGYVVKLVDDGQVVVKQ